MCHVNPSCNRKNNDYNSPYLKTNINVFQVPDLREPIVDIARCEASLDASVTIICQNISKESFVMIDIEQ